MTFIMAEAGTNHLGSPLRALEYVDAAAAIGCDGIKFQLFTKSELFCPYPGDEDRKNRWDISVMNLNAWQTVRNFARDRDIKFCVSVFQSDGVHLANELNCDFIKVASRANKTFPYEYIKGPFIVSLSLGDKIQTPQATWLQCSMNYPSTLEESRWRGLYPGLSDHSGTPWPAIDACFRGADMVEVHFSIDPCDAGPDEAVCLVPYEMEMICEARDAAAAMRSG